MPGSLMADSLIAELGKCRDAFPVPAPHSKLKPLWSAAMSDPASIPAYVCAAAAHAREARLQAQEENARLKERIARSRIDLLRELRESGWNPPAAPKTKGNAVNSATPSQGESTSNDLWTLIEAYTRASVDVALNPSHESAKAYAAMARASLQEALKDALDTQVHPATPMLPPVEGDLLPPVGTKVLIHLASSKAWVEHEVVGYYVWGDLKGDPDLQRVNVRVKSQSGYLNARMLSEVRRLDGSYWVPTAKGGPVDEDIQLRPSRPSQA